MKINTPIPARKVTSKRQPLVLNKPMAVKTVRWIAMISRNEPDSIRFFFIES
jgi:hypothetical protein